MKFSISHLTLLYLFILGCSPIGSLDTTVGEDITEGSPLQLCTNSCSQPLQICSQQNPCTTNSNPNLIESSEIPTCAGGTLESFVNDAGTTRYYCNFVDSSITTPRPLVIFLHGGSGNAGNLTGSTDLLEKSTEYELLSGIKGFHLVALQSRNLHLDFGRLNDGAHFDTYTWSESNQDVQDIDRLVQIISENSNISASNIHIIGWSEGGMMAQLYGAIRHTKASKYGYNVTSAAIFSASSPFTRRFENNEICSCNFNFTTNFPTLIISRACDVIPCNKSQEDHLWALDSFSDVINIEEWSQQQSQTLQNDNYTHNIIDGLDNYRESCTSNALCGIAAATINHISWPNRNESEMLFFLKSHTSSDIADLNLSFCDDIEVVEHGILCAIQPSRTDITIKDIYNNDTAVNRALGFGYHVIGIPHRFTGKTHFHFGGSYGRPYNQNAQAFQNTLFLDEGMKAGRMMIQIAYNNRFQVNSDTCAISPGAETDNCAGLVRSRKITGSNTTSLDDTTTNDSINNRVDRLISYLKANSILDSTFTHAWSNSELSGHSQGGGQAYFISKYYGGTHLCMISGGYDVPDSINPGGLVVADWLLDNSQQNINVATSVSSFVHINDENYSFLSLGFERIGVVNQVETNRSVMTNQDGDAITNPHIGTISAQEFRERWADLCFVD